MRISIYSSLRDEHAGHGGSRSVGLWKIGVLKDIPATRYWENKEKEFGITHYLIMALSTTDLELATVEYSVKFIGRPINLMCEMNDEELALFLLTYS